MRPATWRADELARYSEGYKYLGVSQAILGHDFDPHSVTLDERYRSCIYGC